MRGWTRDWLLALAVLLLAMAALLPPVPMERRVFSHLLVFDITQSMNVADQSVDGLSLSRLAWGKRLALQALADLPCGSRLGLSVFASRRTLLLLAPVEVCANYDELEQAINQIDSRMAWTQASVIARGLYTAIEAAAELPQPPSLLFISDGHSAPPVDEENVPEFSAPPVPAPIRGVVMGVGSLTPQPIPRSDSSGRFVGWWEAADVVQRSRSEDAPDSQEHLSALHERHLQVLARVTGLSYARIDSAAAFRRASQDPTLAQTLLVPTDVRWIPALAGALLLTVFFLPRQRAIPIGELLR
jgi:mxaL protein